MIRCYLCICNPIYPDKESLRAQCKIYCSIKLDNTRWEESGNQWIHFFEWCLKEKVGRLRDTTESPVPSLLSSPSSSLLVPTLSSDSCVCCFSASLKEDNSMLTSMSISASASRLASAEAWLIRKSLESPMQMLSMRDTCKETLLRGYTALQNVL